LEFNNYLKKESKISSLAKALDSLSIEILNRIEEASGKLNLNVESIGQNANLNILNMLSEIQKSKSFESKKLHLEEYINNELSLNFDTTIKYAFYKEIARKFNYLKACHINPLEYTTIYFYLQTFCYLYKCRYI
jgi:hypothetical protein